MSKTCSKCFIHKLLNEFHKLEKGSQGRHPICKKCRSKFRKKRNNNVNVRNKVCIRCNKNLLANFFYKNKNSNDGLQSYCKCCHKEKMADTNSELKKFSKIILKKYIKKQKSKNDIKFEITDNDIIRKYREQMGLCYITKHEITHICDLKQRTDNLWNMSLHIDDDCSVIKYDNFHLVIHLIYTIKELYNLSNKEAYKAYKKISK